MNSYGPEAGGGVGWDRALGHIPADGIRGTLHASPLPQAAAPPRSPPLARTCGGRAPSVDWRRVDWRHQSLAVRTGGSNLPID